MIASAATDESQFFLELLHFTGQTLQSWGELNQLEAQWYISTFSERNKRHNRDMQKAKQGRR